MNINALTGLQADVLQAIAHPNRIRILQTIRHGVACNCELSPALGLEQSNLSRHLKILVKSGILISWKEGLRVNYKVADKRIFAILDTVANIVKAEARKKADSLSA